MVTPASASLAAAVPAAAASLFATATAQPGDPSVPQASFAALLSDAALPAAAPAALPDVPPPAPPILLTMDADAPITPAAATDPLTPPTSEAGTPTARSLAADLPPSVRIGATATAAPAAAPAIVVAPARADAALALPVAPPRSGAVVSSAPSAPARATKPVGDPGPLPATAAPPRTTAPVERHERTGDEAPSASADAKTRTRARRESETFATTMPIVAAPPVAIPTIPAPAIASPRTATLANDPRAPSARAVPQAAAPIGSPKRDAAVAASAVAAGPVSASPVAASLAPAAVATVYATEPAASQMDESGTALPPSTAASPTPLPSPERALSPSPGPLAPASPLAKPVAPTPPIGAAPAPAGPAPADTTLRAPTRHVLAAARDDMPARLADADRDAAAIPLAAPVAAPASGAARAAPTPPIGATPAPVPVPPSPADIAAHDPKRPAPSSASGGVPARATNVDRDAAAVPLARESISPAISVADAASEPVVGAAQEPVATTAPGLAALAESRAALRDATTARALPIDPSLPPPTPRSVAILAMPAQAPTVDVLASRVSRSAASADRAEAPTAARRGTRERPREAAIVADVVGATPASADPSPRAGGPSPAAREAAPQAGQQLAAGGADRQVAVARHAAWADGIARDVSRAGADSGTARFTVASAALGPIGVAVSRDGAGAQVMLTASNAAARDLLDAAKPQLIAEARGQGLHIRDAQVDLGGMAMGSNGSGSASNGAPRSGDPVAVPAQPAPAGATVATSLTAGGYGAGGSHGGGNGDAARQQQGQPQPGWAAAMPRPATPSAPADAGTDGDRPVDGRYA